MPAAKRARGGAAAAPSTGGDNEPAAAAAAALSPLSSRHGGLTAVHRSRMVDWAVEPVAAVAPCPDGIHVGVGYGDGSVEVWDARAGFCRLARVPGEDGAELSALAWVPDALAHAPAAGTAAPSSSSSPPSSSAVTSIVSAWRLFQARLDGTIREVFPAALDPSSSSSSSSPAAISDSYGGAVWAMAAEPASAVRAGFAAHLAAACDDGSVRLFAVEPGEPGVQYVGVIGRAVGEASAAKRDGGEEDQGGSSRKRRGGDLEDSVSNSTRCLSVAWHPSGAAVVAGCSDGLVRAWDAGPALGAGPAAAAAGGKSSSASARGRELLRVSVGANSLAALSLCVWAVAVLPDGVIVTGASDGAVCFFEPRSGALLSRHARHRADVLSLAVAPDGNGVFAAGVDARVALYARVGGGAGQWQYLDYKAPHTHDVRALGVLLPPAAAAAALQGGGGRCNGSGSGANASSNVVGRRRNKRGGKATGGSGSSVSFAADLDAGALLFSGGADGQVMAYGAGRQRFLREHPARLTKAPQAPLVSMTPAPGAPTAAAARLLSVRGRQADVWQLGVAYTLGAEEQGNEDALAQHADEGAPLELSAAPRHLARLVASGPQHVAAAAIASDGQLVALSDPASGVRVYRLLGGKAAPDAVSVSRVKLAARPRSSSGGGRGGGAAAAADDPSLVLPPAVALAFVPSDPRTLVCADGSGVLRAVSLKGAVPGDEVDGGSSGDDEGAVVGKVVATAVSAARHAAAPLPLGMRPAVSHLAISPDGAWVAAATAAVPGKGNGGGGGAAASASSSARGAGTAVELFSLPGLKSHGTLLLVDPLAMPPFASSDVESGDEQHQHQHQHQQQKSKRAAAAAAAAAAALPPVAALAFSPDSQTLVVATAGNAVAAYDVRSRAPTTWTRRYAAAAAELLGTLPGAVAGLAFGGGGGGVCAGGHNSNNAASMVVYTPGGVASLDLGSPISLAHLRGGGAADPAGARSHSRRRSAAKPPREGPGAAGVPVGATQRGANGRVLLLENPCLFFGYSSPDEAVLLEHPFSAVLERLPPPLQRQRYGS
jgi:U3 small nucleolar RNA-associated protein 4